MRLSAVAALLVLVLTPAAARASAGTSIFYYPWWGNPERDGKYLHWDRGGHVPPADLAAGFYPLRGAYSSADPAVVRAQMRDIARAGISEVVSSWWGWGSPEDLRLPLVLQATRAFGLTVAVQIEPYEKWQRNAEVLAADLGHLRDLGIRRAYVYQPFGSLIDDASWLQLAQGAAGIQLLAQTTNVSRAAADGFAGVYTYLPYFDHPRALAALCRRAHQKGLLCVPSTGPGYDARRANGDPRVHDRKEGATYDRTWRAALKARPDRIAVTSYNEWHEGTQIEAAADRAAMPRGHGYETYDGAYGLKGNGAVGAYLTRTAYWIQLYRLTAAVTRVVQTF